MAVRKDRKHYSDIYHSCRVRTEKVADCVAVKLYDDNNMLLDFEWFGCDEDGFMTRGEWTKATFFAYGLHTADMLVRRKYDLPR